MAVRGRGKEKNKEPKKKKESRQVHSKDLCGAHATMIVAIIFKTRELEVACLEYYSPAPLEEMCQELQ